MRPFTGILACALIAAILLDAFETIILPRRVSRKFRIATAFYRVTWAPWSGIARQFQNRKRMENWLSYYGPLSLLMLFTVWAAGIVLGFGTIYWSLGSSLISTNGGKVGFGSDLYMSGTTFFTLGLGDLTPRSPVTHLVTVLEGGMGFGFLAAIIGYLPIVYQAFSRREANISLLDARAGSPPTAEELLRRHAQSGNVETLLQLLADWERWSAELLESHISYPVLCYFRSQHDNQSWLAALTTVLDASALVLTGVEKLPTWQAELTFAMARHAMVDLAQVFGRKPLKTTEDRLPHAGLEELRGRLSVAGIRVCEGPDAERRLAERRAMYEPYVAALSGFLLMATPGWLRELNAKENWKTTAWKMLD